MGWFYEQIRRRERNDDEQLTDAIVQMVNIVSNEKLVSRYAENNIYAQEAVGDILQFYHVKMQEVPNKMKDINDVLEYLLRPSGIMRRSVRLSDDWYKDCVGAMLGTKTDGTVIAMIPRGAHGYYYRDYVTGNKIIVNKKTASEIDNNAVCFYQPFPLRKLRSIDIFRYMFGIMRLKDYAVLLIVTMMVMLFGMVVPLISRYLYCEVLDLKSVKLLTGAVLTLFFTLLASQFITNIKNILNENIKTRMNLSVESAAMIRVLSLPTDFFRQYSSGELTNRISYMNVISGMFFEAVFSIGLTAIFSLLYIIQINMFAPVLLLPTLLILISTTLVSVIATFLRIRIVEREIDEASKENGLIYALINGLSKIKNAGAEKRAFTKWSRQYVKVARYRYNPPFFIKVSKAVSTAIMLLGTVLLYNVAMKAHVEVADYMAFNSAYGMVSGAFMALAGMVATISNIPPVLKMVRPIFEAVPEIDTNRTVVTRLSGSIELNNVTFGYQESMPKVIDNITLKIRPGQYVAIVGKTGCGKSTLMRLLLGFEKPLKGAVYYDGKDMASVDLKSLRQKIGVVMQNEKLFQGDIYSNITISAPWLTVADAWEAAELAGMADDIRQMPMGMNTLISEGYGGISGGQRQRLLIARAIAKKPRILMFDEATSALDNVTQKIVSESLDRLKCTRIVVAHRLSTIKHCDRIIVLDQGKIVEDGKYDELLVKDGVFAELVARQQVSCD